MVNLDRSGQIYRKSCRNSRKRGDGATECNQKCESILRQAAPRSGARSLAGRGLSAKRATPGKESCKRFMLPGVSLAALAQPPAKFLAPLRGAAACTLSRAKFLSGADFSVEC
jgi:hypothetical protein